MKFNNSIKIAIANFALFWKILIYKLIAVAVGILFVLPVSGTLKTAFSLSGFNGQIKALFSADIFRSLTAFASNLMELFNSFTEGVLSLAKSNVFVFIYFLIVALIVLPFLFKLSDVPASETVYSYMSSLNKNSFTINFISTLGKSLGYALFKVIFEIPFWIILFFGTKGIMSLCLYDTLWLYFSPLLLFVFIVVMFALNITFFNGLAPSVVVFNECATKAFGKGIRAVKRNFASTLSSFAVTMTAMVALCYLFGVYSLIVIVPLVALINAVFGQVLFFESQGMDYYISLENIVTPRKLESADKIRKVKYII